MGVERRLTSPPPAAGLRRSPRRFRNAGPRKQTIWFAESNAAKAHAPGGTQQGCSWSPKPGSIDWWPTTPGAWPSITPAQASAAASKGRRPLIRQPVAPAGSPWGLTSKHEGRGLGCALLADVIGRTHRFGSKKFGLTGNCSSMAESTSARSHSICISSGIRALPPTHCTGAADEGHLRDDGVKLQKTDDPARGERGRHAHGSVHTYPYPGQYPAGSECRGPSADAPPARSQARGRHQFPKACVSSSGWPGQPAVAFRVSGGSQSSCAPGSRSSHC